jgi:hypothetical protein
MEDLTKIVQTVFLHSTSADSLLRLLIGLVQQNKRLVSRMEFPPTLPEPLVDMTLLLYKQGKERALQGGIKGGRERDASR